MRSLAAVLLAALVACVNGDASMRGMMAMAPGPASMAPKADLLFILSANTANFTSPQHLVLGGVSATTQFTGNGRHGIYPTALFTNSSDDAAFVSPSGDWLGNPQAVLYGTPKTGNMTAIIVNLANPKYDPETNTATFDVTVVAPTATNQKFTQGAVASAVADASKNLGPMVAATADATTELRAAALFIDTNRLALGKTGETKWWGWGGGWGGGGWGGGWYRPYYYQPYYYSYQPYYYGGYGGCNWGCG